MFKYDKAQSNFDLFKYAERLNIKLNDVLMNDEVHNKLLNGYYILNLQNKNQGGSHWVGLIKDNKNIYYFDSYGFPPTQHIVETFKKPYKLFFNDILIQDLKSDNCGFFCLGLFLYMDNYFDTSILKTFDNYCEMFNDEVFKKNDKMLKDFLNKFI